MYGSLEDEALEIAPDVQGNRWAPVWWTKVHSPICCAARHGSPSVLCQLQRRTLQVFSVNAAAASDALL